MSHLCVVRCLMCVCGFELCSSLNCEWIHLLHSFFFKLLCLQLINVYYRSLLCAANFWVLAGFKYVLMGLLHASVFLWCRCMCLSFVC